MNMLTVFVMMATVISQQNKSLSCCLKKCAFFDFLDCNIEV
eukprot:02773.XXX_65621_65743_1 [CDS] Oithona nana genome sequencing.